MMHMIPRYSFLIVSLLIGSETLESLVVFLVPGSYYEELQDYTHSVILSIRCPMVCKSLGE